MLTVDLNQLLFSLSLAMDFHSHGLLRHHQRVALLALRLAEEMGLPEEQCLLLYQAAIVHDAGVSTWQDKSTLGQFELEQAARHSQRGAVLLQLLDRATGTTLAPVLLSHHDRWDGRDNPSGLAGEAIPLAARIIHLADRVDVLLQNGYVLHYQQQIVDKVSQLAGSVFDPQLVRLFARLARRESLWLDLTGYFMSELLQQEIRRWPLQINLAGLLALGEIFSAVVDAKSPFTHRHSRLVAAVAARLAEGLGFEEREVQQVRLAGLLHDLGKLSVPESILEKPGRLTEAEFDVIKQHTYYTYHILNQVPQLERIRDWAAFHHEKLDGNGYPFKVDAGRLDTGCRLMAVADVFAALVEDRPYRPGMPVEKALDILSLNARAGQLDRRLVALAERHAGELAEMARTTVSLPGES
ncbi:MAG: HD domain-containing phosphohydrolase [Desulfurispora sp.]|uniref:HD domain-containing phosphohydrolase n=1 Tax=Desulfurispora sp. TaxID=3014275 RepID=UPI00404978E4